MSEITTKYLIFNIGEEDYAMPISKVKQVLRYVAITHIHEASEFLKGVINLRGKIIPIIDMRLKFGIQEKEYSDRTVFIIVEVITVKEEFNLGIVVDAVQDVVDISNEDLEKTPDIGLKLKSQYLDGIAKINEKMIMLLNIDKILTSNEIVNINKVNEDQIEVVE